MLCYNSCIGGLVVTSSYFSNPEEISRKLREARVSPRQVRDYIFRSSRDAGDLDNALIDLWESGALGDPDEDYGYESIDGPELRGLASVEDFPNRVPFQGYSIDPDYEDYSAFRLAAENPKAAQYLENQDFSLDQPVQQARQDLYDAYRSRRINSNDLTRLNTAGESEFLSEQDYDRPSTEIVSDIIRNVTGGEADYAELMPRVATALERIDEVTRPVTAAVRSYETAANVARQRGSRNPFDEELRSRQRGDLSGATQLGLPVVESNPLIDRLLQGDLPSSFEDFSSESPELLRAARSRTSNPYLTDPELNVRNQILPEVRDILSERQINTAISRYLNERDQERSARNSLYNIERDLSALNREQELMQRALARRPSEISLDFPGREEGLRPIPGLPVQLAKTKDLAAESELNEGAKKINKYIEKYPETAAYFQGLATRGKPNVERNLSALQGYVDTEQQISKPEDRLKLYKKIGTDLGVPVEQFKQLERNYTSGDPEKQKQVIDYIARLGYGSDLESISAPALSRRFPVVGGGGYDSENQEVKELKKYISKRAQDFDSLRRNISGNSALQLLRTNNPTSSFSSRVGETFSYDPETQTAQVDPEGPYKVALSRGLNERELRIEDPLSGFINDDISTNVLRYLADNPITDIRSISFSTATPDNPGLDYDAKDIPRPVFNLMESFIRENALAGIRPGTLLINEPLNTYDIVRNLEAKGIDPSESSILRRNDLFLGEKPNRRAAAYRAGGFGPLTESREQFAFVNSEGNIVPLQPTRAAGSLAGKLQIEPAEVLMTRTRPPRISISQSREPLTSKAYFSLDPVAAATAGLKELGAGIKQAPSSLLPGVADLIPSPEAIQTGYARGPAAMGQQMAQEFVQSLPATFAATSVLATPVAAPLAPGIGAGLVGAAGARALNEIVRQETGEGIVPKLRQYIGTAPRTGAAAKPRVGERPLTAQLKPLTSGQRSELQRQQNRNELQRRIDLFRERVNPSRGEFGLSELLFGR